MFTSATIKETLAAASGAMNLLGTIVRKPTVYGDIGFPEGVGR